MPSANVKIAVQYTKDSMRVVAKGGVIAFPMFEGATKSDVKAFKNELKKIQGIKSAMVDKKVAVISVE